MLNQKKIYLMSRLAMLEKEKGKELRRVRENFHSDYIGIPLLKNALRVTVIFLMILCLWSAGSVDFILMVTAQGQLKLLGIGILTAYLVVLLVAMVITFLCTSSRYYRDLRYAREYEELLKDLQAMEETGCVG